MNRKAFLLPLLRVALAVPLWFCAFGAMACTERTMLELIGTLEAPKGYDQVYSGVSVQPPRPITTMTVGEVLEWQRLASRTSVSTAAGRYQVIRGTLSNMVDQGVVSVDDIYSPRTQDRLVVHLLRSTGYRNGSTSPEVANRAALPLVSGPRKGLSAYHGIANNKARTTPANVLAMLNGQPFSTKPTRIARETGGPGETSTPRIAKPRYVRIRNAMRQAAQAAGNRTVPQTWVIDPYAME